MKPANKSTKRPPGAAELPEFVDTFIPLYRNAVKRLTELEKKSMEVAVEQNAEWMAAWKHLFHAVPETPGLFMFDVYQQLFGQYIETQKGIIDLANDQCEAVAGLAKDRGASVSRGQVAEDLTGLFQQAVEHSVAVQKKALDFYATQQKTAYEAAKRQFRISGTPAAEAFVRGIDTLIETQKSMLDIASKPLKRAAAA